MRRLLFGAISRLLVGLVAGSATASDRAQGGGRDDRATELTLYATETAFTLVSATGQVNPPEDDPSAFTAGARLLIVETVFSDEARTKPAGRNDILCTIIEVTGTVEAPGDATLVCDGVIRLNDKGSLTWMGSVTFAAAEEEPEGAFATLAITGGTGKFRAAGGEITIFDESTTADETLSRYEIDLLRFETKG